MRSQLIAAVAVAFILAACASTQSVSIRNPEFATKQFHKVVVYGGNIANLMYRKQMEDGLVQALQRKGINAVSSLAIVGADDNQEERLAAYRAAGADCALAVKVDDASVSEHVISGPTATTTASANCYGGSCSGQSTTRVNPAQVAHRPHMSFRAKVTELDSMKIAWQGQAQGDGNGYASFDTVVASFQEKTAEDLASSGLFAVRVAHQ